jgi:hypothetical protein
MNGPSNPRANNPACTNPAADSVEFGTSADGFPVARISEILLGHISRGSGEFSETPTARPGFNPIGCPRQIWGPDRTAA